MDMQSGTIGVVHGDADSRTPSERQRANLKPFQKGVSGNPGGKSKILGEIQSLARKHSPRSFARILELVEDPDPRVALVAAREVLDRAYGKPRVIEDDDADKKSVTINIVRYADAAEGNVERRSAGSTVQIRSIDGQALLGVSEAKG